MEQIFEITLDEPEGTITRRVFPLVLTPQNLQTFWDKARHYPIIYGRQVIENVDDFLKIFLVDKGTEYELNGMLWVVDNFVGMFYLSDITSTEAYVHYTFFDRRHKGRIPLVREMMKYVFNRYGFQRLNVEIPLYSGEGVRHFIIDCGFIYEGKKRACMPYKGKWFDANLYGILRGEVLKNGSAKD